VTFAPGETRHLLLEKATWEAPEPPRAAPERPAREAPPAPVRRPAPLGTFVGLGVAGAAGATAAVCGVLTLDAGSDFDARPTDATADRFEALRAATNVSLAVTGAALLVAAALWLLHRP
jgi:hypothetical protein